MFYDIFEKLCREHKTTPSAVCIKIGYSKGTASYWKQSGKAPKREALEKIADLFGITVNDLLQKVETEHVMSRSLENMTAIAQKNAPIITNRSEMISILAMLSDAEIDILLDTARNLLAKRQFPTDT